MRWEYADPDPTVIVIEPESVRIWDPAERKLQIAAMSEGVVSPTALGFLLGEGDLATTFAAEMLPADGRAELGVRLVPRDEVGFEALELWLEPESLELAESVLHDLFGNRTRVRFAEVRENVGVPDGTFDLDVPEGTEVIDLR
jgi:outer membrane lipoprotein-sorting protein